MWFLEKAGKVRIHCTTLWLYKDFRGVCLASPHRALCPCGRFALFPPHEGPARKNQIETGRSSLLSYCATLIADIIQSFWMWCARWSIVSFFFAFSSLVDFILMSFEHINIVHDRDVEGIKLWRVSQSIAPQLLIYAKRRCPVSHSSRGER